MHLIDSENTQALLIGIRNYDDAELPELKAAERNIDRFKKLLAAEGIGMQAENITSVYNETNKDRLLKLIKETASKARKSLIIYYAGHGILDEDFNLYLTVSSTTVEDVMITGIPIDIINNLIKKSKPDIVFILDCCFSEAAFDKFRKSNYYVLASSKKNTPSKYPLEEEHSAFSNALLEVLESGVDVPKAELTLRDIYVSVREKLMREGFPEPRQVNTNIVQEKVFTKNNYRKVDPAVDLNKRIINPVYFAMQRYLDTPDTGGITEDDMFGDEELSRYFEGEDEAYTESLQLTEKANKIIHNFPLLVGEELKLLFAPKSNLEQQSEERLKRVLAVYTSVSKFISYALISQLWDEKVRSGITVSDTLKTLFEELDQPYPELYTKLTVEIGKLFEAENIRPFVGEFSILYKRITRQDHVYEAYKKMEDLHKQDSFSESDFSDAEDALTVILENTAFLAAYKMVSVRNILLSKPKNDVPLFLHRINQLHIDSRQSDISKPPVSLADYTDSHSILLVKNTELRGGFLNLSPLIVDKNALAIRSIPSVHFFERKIESEDGYYYHRIGSRGDELVPLASRFEDMKLLRQIKRLKEAVLG